jgi:TonB family protein
MLPVHRCSLRLLGMLLSGAALAQTVQPEVDESKLPEWVKRQARSPYKVIIESDLVRTKPAARKVEQTPKTVANNPTTSAPAAAAKPASASTAFGPASAVSVSPAVAATQQPAAAEPAPEASRVETAGLAVPSAPRELTPLILVNRVEPAVSTDLIDSRLNTARVVLAFTVNTSGEVSNLSVVSTTDTRLNRSVLRAVQAWRYAQIPEPREHMVSFAFTSD